MPLLHLKPPLLKPHPYLKLVITNQNTIFFNSGGFSSYNLNSAVPCDVICDLTVSSKYKEFGEPWDPNSSQRPPGWAEMKLRRVYLKEWQDRKDGVDEDEILERRYQRELEVTTAKSQICDGWTY